MSQSDAPGFADEIAHHLPFLRRYARALTGNQEHGDRYAAATLEAIIGNRGFANPELGSRIALFRAFHRIWTSTGAPISAPELGLPARAQLHLSGLRPNAREALLLNVIEGFTVGDISLILHLPRPQVSELIETARAEIQESVSGRLLIIEDEPIIALDLRAIVQDLGHGVTGIARTRKDAVALGKKDKPDMILADIALADDSSGIDAVTDLLGHFGDLPVIFITAFPERLLSGAKPEPAFLITKPYDVEQIRTAVGQAMFFASTETLHQQPGA